MATAKHLPGVPAPAEIAQKVRSLRKGRGLSQGQLARLLQLSTSRLCEIEGGKGSFTAEQLIFLLKFFNVPLSHFETQPEDPGDAIQKALAHHGAEHLVENRDLLPSERLERLETVIQEALLDAGSARWIAALAPVLVRNIDQVNLQKLYAKFRDYGLQNRFLWLLDNVAQAVREAQEEPLPRKQLVLLRRALSALEAFREWIQPGLQQGEEGPEDTLGSGILSPETRKEIRQSSSEISKRWRILTSIQVADFKDALRESNVIRQPD
jgi:transcriptional regulator with XRE-family HTH domain